MSNPLADASDTIERHMVDLTFEHKCDEKAIHKLSIVFSVQDDKAVSRHRKSDQLKMQLVVIHTNKNKQLWMVRFSMHLYLYYMGPFIFGQCEHEFMCNFSLSPFIVRMFILLQIVVN